jgi:hypothetical protein
MERSETVEKYFIEEDPHSGEIYIHDAQGDEIMRFAGDEALRAAVRWAQDQGFTLHSTLDPEEMTNRNRLLFRRSLRLFRARRGLLPTARQDAPNVRRIIVANDDDMDWDHDDLPTIYNDPAQEEWQESIDLAPKDD